MIIETKSKQNIFFEYLFFRVMRKSVSTFFHVFRQRPGSYPYITGDSFRKIANHVHDETTTLNPSDVGAGDIVFVSSPKMEEYFTNVHPLITKKYILIEHNGDVQVDEKIASFIDEKIVVFYAQCVTVAHEKIIPIPIGIENKHHGIEGFSWFMNKKSKKSKKPRIFFHFSVQTNPSERGPALNYFKSNSLMDTISKFIPYSSYKKILSSYYFTVSPAGNTLGSHRTWEALYLRTIPIVKRTVDAESLAYLGLPIWILDNWQELDSFTEDMLQKKYEKMMSPASFEALFMDYWIARIHADQKLIREKE